MQRYSADDLIEGLAVLTTSASRGAVRDVSRIQK